GRRDDLGRGARKGVTAGNGSGNDFLRFDRPLEIGRTVLGIGQTLRADKGPGGGGGPPTTYQRARRSLTPQPRKKGHFTKRSGNSKFTRSPGIPGGTGGKSRARRHNPRPPPPGALRPAERTRRPATTRPLPAGMHKNPGNARSP